MKELSKIVQESVESYKKDFFCQQKDIEGSHVYYEIIDEIPPHDELIDAFLSSQISLLEAELERKKGMFKELISYESDERGWNECLRNDIIYITEQIAEIKKLTARTTS